MADRKRNGSQFSCVYADSTFGSIFGIYGSSCMQICGGPQYGNYDPSDCSGNGNLGTTRREIALGVSSICNCDFYAKWINNFHGIYIPIDLGMALGVLYIWNSWDNCDDYLPVCSSTSSSCSSEYPNISERTYLEKMLYSTFENDEPVPWAKILTSIHFWAIIVGHAGYSLFVMLFVTEMPPFLAKVTKYDLQSNGTASAIPKIISTVSGIFISIISDYIPRHGLLSVLNTRRFFHLTWTLLMTTAVICTTYIPEQLRIWAVVLYCIVTIADESISMTGVSVNIYDLSPKYAGIITGISHSISQGVSAFAPSLVDWVCTDLSDASQWRTVFIITSVIALSSAIFFAIFASSQRQNWGTESEEDARIEAVIKRKGSIFSIYSLAA
uniref:Major facilitator superfamily (MFS) profile domain-containing protein n=1 Tax=Dendroctonus ponderosae TaxID=77166 RepID=A0AAR5PY10_DENPD